MPRKICLVAGEASGDALGARLMEALKAESPEAVTFCGVGGPLMEAQGLATLFPMGDLSVMGIAEVLPRLGTIIARINQTVSFIAGEKPDVVVTIDSPDFCFRVARKVRAVMEKPPRMIHYVAPTVWAWRPERTKKVAALYDGMICLYPFEPSYFEEEGMKAVFAGHPVIEYEKGNGKGLRTELGIPSNAPVLGLLFGSRMGELNRTGPILHDAAAKLSESMEGLHIISPTFPHLAKQARNLLRSLDAKTHLITDHVRKQDCFAAMDMAIATSGTVGLELAVAGVPHVIAYKMSPLTWRIVKRRVKVKYAHLANILLDTPLVPEFIQEKCRAEDIVSAIRRLDSGKLKNGFGKLRYELTGAGTGLPSLRAARFVLDLIAVDTGLQQFQTAEVVNG